MVSKPDRVWPCVTQLVVADPFKTDRCKTAAFVTDGFGWEDSSCMSRITERETVCGDMWDPL